MFHSNFCKPVHNRKLYKIYVNDEMQWLHLDKVYPGIMAHETMKSLLPQEKESFLKPCHDWYREVVQQILSHVNVADPVLLALKDVSHKAILNGMADRVSAGVVAKCVPHLLGCGSPPLQSQIIQDID